ncbi:hypothetical protein [Streptomyces sp. CoH27]|uniref:hypothetical protein n=1 Tax=Streptomyces sp. CoH27 TaxID=2875763 RepID=UPI001CD4CBE5|nr:hypothetical protein [Streptomyces sp. CoH27]
MAEQRKGAAGPGEDPGPTALLFGLTDVDLRTLRAMDDPDLMAVVGDVLRGSREFGEVWYVGDEPAESGKKGGVAPGDRTFPAGVAARDPGEDDRE